ncbi:tyrosine-type recombinase/integrase [Nesterenkonia alba]|uniref:tyrosine-type recombinase/integrase n=1 Tax=Nesterenkonia alba TaxID=515814 RepID=UPI00146D1019|nr:site-specific integrase [Nesterenkonia alba]
MWRTLNKKQRSKTFNKNEKRKAKEFKAKVEAELNEGYEVDLKLLRKTFQDWSEEWKQGQRVNRESTYRQVETDLKRLNDVFGERRLRSITVSEVKTWVASMKAEGLEQTTIYAKYRRFKQIMDAAVEEGILVRSPCTKSTTPGMGKREQQIPTVKQVWDLYNHVPDGLKPAVLLGAFSGLRASEVVAIDERRDIDYARGLVKPKLQHGGVLLKTDSSEWQVPIAEEMALELSLYVDQGHSNTLVRSAYGQSITPNRMQVVVKKSADALGFYEKFRFHDLRHFYASMLISEGLDVVTVQHCMRHSTPNTTLRTYSHLWPDADEAPRAAVQKLFAAREASSKEDSNVGNLLGAS